MSGIVEVSDVDGPDGDADDRDNLGELLSELVEFLLKRGLLSLGFGHLRADFTNLSGQASSKDDTAGFSGGNVGSREQTVLLVLIHGTGIGHGIGVLNDGNGFSSEDGLIDAERRGVDLDQTQVGRDFVSD